MEKLSKMPNIGTVIEQKLIQAGITTPNQLRSIGSKEAFIRIRAFDDTACINMLCALEGAIQGMRRRYLDDAVKADLKAFFDSLK